MINSPRKTGLKSRRIFVRYGSVQCSGPLLESFRIDDRIEEVHPPQQVVRHPLHRVRHVDHGRTKHVDLNKKIQIQPDVNFLTNKYCFQQKYKFELDVNTDLLFSYDI